MNSRTCCPHNAPDAGRPWKSQRMKSNNRSGHVLIFGDFAYTLPRDTLYLHPPIQHPRAFNRGSDMPRHDILHRISTTPRPRQGD